ncbi:hypothetical protein [Legionella maioricensis]|uniref:Uncharacterized protein n=1 Tax=Legionella maioricensis TaxID=2896528 RepID=A0A9X2D485_9GAMM|nr:hypothetical protein [Legionella maioricensis]MCL9685257.1 hypothetical protein [Legionella maioricensis]MCL9688474.1 hypothetical protein [Legionella maioricensis]
MPKYTNTSPIDFEDITTETGIMVISYTPDEPQGKPRVTYYSSQKDFEDGWSVDNCCPLTKQTHYISVPLSSLTADQLASLYDPEQETDLEQDNPEQEHTLQDTTLEMFAENSYAREIFNKSMKLNLEVQGILDGFKEKIASIGEHHQPAKGIAQQLYDDLIKLKENIVKEPTKNSASFPQKVKELIRDATPALQRDLGWGDYLSNLAIKICNAATKFFSAGFHQGFFTIKTSAAVESAEALGNQLEEDHQNRNQKI